LAGQINVRLQNCLSFPPPDPGLKLNDASPRKVTGTNKEATGGIDFSDPGRCGPVYNVLLLKWVQRLQFKLVKLTFIFTLPLIMLGMSSQCACTENTNLEKMNFNRNSKKKIFLINF